MSIVSNMLDTVCDTLGIRYIREPITFDDESGATTLELAAYRQTQTYTCGFTAGLSVLHTFHPRKSSEAFLARVAPHPENGTPDARLIRALRQSGIGVSATKALDFDSICENVEAGYPIIVTVSAHQPADHWCVLYGVRRGKERSVFLAGNGVPYLTRNEVPWGEFRRSVWSPVGEGLVCWGK